MIIERVREKMLKLHLNYLNHFDYLLSVLESWNKLSDQNIDLNLLTSGLASKLENLIEFTPNVSSKCAQSLFRLRSGAKKMKLWAIKALDSWGRFPNSGFMHGTFNSLGDYDTCLENDNLQYCAIHLRPLLPTRKLFENVNTRIKILNKFINDKDKVCFCCRNKLKNNFKTNSYSI